MGCHADITHAKFPGQGDRLGKEVELMFHYTDPVLPARCIRDDMEEPFRTIFLLGDGRALEADECQYSQTHRTRAAGIEMKER